MTLFSEDIYSRKMERLMTAIPNFKHTSLLDILYRDESMTMGEMQHDRNY